MRTKKKSHVKCPSCGNPAVITSRNTITAQKHDLYCQCMNTAECGASFVLTLSLSHYLNPPQRTTAQIAAAFVMGLPANERKELFSQVDLFA